MAEYFGNICTCRRCNGIVHTIKRGDSLYLLSRHYKVTVNDIMRANSNVNIYNLQIGDQICIPVRRPEPMPIRPGQNTPPPQLPPGAPVPPVRPGQPTPIQPRERDEETEDRLEGLLDEILETSTVVSDRNENMEVSATCCGGMRVKDILQNEDMTMEELAKMIKNM